jgi:transcription elongation GreA/GreB family factor
MSTAPPWESRLPKRNYGYEKRQKELHKQQKREEKLKRKLERADVPADEPAGDESASRPPAE